jgi:hypothetical protein
VASEILYLDCQSPQEIFLYRVQCALPSHPAQININCMSKLHAAIIFWVSTPFLLINDIWFSCDTQTCTCVLPIALIQFYIKKIVFGFIAISIGVVENSGSTGLISSTASKHTDLRTSLKYLLMVSPECWNLPWTFLFQAPRAKV